MRLTSALRLAETVVRISMYVTVILAQLAVRDCSVKLHAWLTCDCSNGLSIQEP